MSGHLIGCVKPLELPQSHKLALVAFADSADDRTHIAFPGYEGVQEWAACSRGRAAELIKDLVSWGWLRQHKKAHRGQRAEYIVFPDGCCDLHRIPVEDPAAVPVDVDQLAAAAGVSVNQARALIAAMAADVHTAGSEQSPQPNGSGTDDPVGGNESGGSDPISTDAPAHVSEAVDNPGMGPERVHGSRSTANAFTPSEKIPPSPAGKPAGATCAKHPNGHPNCRACGTSPRMRAKAAEREAQAAAAAERRRAQLAIREHEQATRSQAASRVDPAGARASLRAAREAVAKNRTAAIHGGTE
jgi:hypothetical protein